MADQIYLVYDPRESAVDSFIETVFVDIEYIKKQIRRADYHICRKRGGAGDVPPTIELAIERKTLNDYAQSFMDGRDANIEKLLALRRETGCLLAYIIEGPPFPSPDRKFHRIPYKNILGSITKLMIRHGILIIQTENQAHTAQRIYELALSIRDEKAEKIYKYPIEAKAETETADVEAAPEGGPPAEVDQQLLVPEAALAKDPESDDLIVARMWAKMKGITLVMGKVITKKFSVAELARGAISIEHIKSLKTANGRELNKKALASLKGIRSGSLTECAKLLGGAKSVGPNVAKSLMEAAGSFSRFCSYGEGEMAIMTIQQKNRAIKLGKAKAERIFRLIHFKAAENGPPQPTPKPAQAPAKRKAKPKAALPQGGADPKDGGRNTPPGGPSPNEIENGPSPCEIENCLSPSEIEDFLDSLRD